MSKKIAQTLLYFQQEPSIESRRKLTDANQGPKWGGKDFISIRMANEVVAKLAD